MQPPTFEDIVAARSFIQPYLPKTPLVRSEKLSQQLGCEFYVKLENLQPVGAFKVRGGVNLVGTLDQQKVTLVAASTGNHGQSIAFAGRLFNKRVIIYAPAENVNEMKMQAMRNLGAEVRLHGRDFDEARLETERVAAAEGFRYIHSANEPKLIAGVGTMGLEIFEDLPNVDVIIAPAGGGSCASGNCIVAKHLNPETRVIAVQSELAPANVARVAQPQSRSVSDDEDRTRRPRHSHAVRTHEPDSVVTARRFHSRERRRDQRGRSHTRATDETDRRRIRRSTVGGGVEKA
ncbi:MAG TPA: pyridoxal-phosphate dependent enzyme [Pyrinomonadaceae bacterium]|nr:pyridoxal-phosphate dependent enzyme [Pyrinomonadaceae bacterium]